MAEKQCNLVKNGGSIGKNYTTTKKVVGYDDSGNPIYGKWLPITLPNGGSAASFDTGETLNKVYGCTGYFDNGGGIIVTIPFAQNTNYAYIYAYLKTASANANKINVYQSNSAWNGCHGYAYIEFQ